MIKFSIIIPVYNVAPYLRECLDSVARAAEQLKLKVEVEDSGVEVICVDDGSMDGSGAILDEYAVKDKRFKVIHQKNQGVSVARNVGLENAIGEWVWFIDGDDEINEDALDSVFRGFPDDKNIDAIGLGVVLAYADGSTKDFGKGGTAPEIIMSGDDLLLQKKQGEYTIFNYCVCNKIFRRKLIDEFNLRFVVGMRHGEDTLFASTYFTRCANVFLRPQLKLYKYKMREGSAIHTRKLDFPPTSFQYVRMYYAAWQKARKVGVGKCLRQSLANLFLLGCGKDKKYRRECISWMVRSQEFNYWARVAVICGGWKVRVVAFSYICLPRCFKGIFLIKVGEAACRSRDWR